MKNPLDKLSREYQRFCAKHGLPAISADELILRPLTDFQAAFVADFLSRWEAAEVAA